MKAGVTTSVVAHAAVLIVAIVGLGSAKPFSPEVVDSIAVDLVPIDDFTNIRAGSLKSEVVETETPAIAKSDKPAEIAQPTGNTEENQIKPEETAKQTPAPVVNTAPEPVPDPQPEPEPDPIPEPVPDPQPVQAPEPVAAPEETAPAAELATDVAETPVKTSPMPARAANLDKLRADFKKEQDQAKKDAAAKKKAEEDKKRLAEQKEKADKQAREADQVAALINNEQSRGATTGAGGTPTLGKTTGTAATLSQDEMGRLIAHVRKCINPPIGSAEEGASVQLSFNLSRDFQVLGQPTVISVIGPVTGQSFASAASRAVVRCQSVDGGYAFLPADKYDGANGWNTVKVTFNANESF